MQGLSSINSNLLKNSNKSFYSPEYKDEQRINNQSAQNETANAKKPYFSAPVNPVSMEFLKKGIIPKNRKDIFTKYPNEGSGNAVTGLKILAAASTIVAVTAALYIRKQNGIMKNIEAKYVQETGKIIQEKASKIYRHGDEIVQEAMDTYNNFQELFGNMETVLARYKDKRPEDISLKSNGLLKLDPAKNTTDNQVFSEFRPDGSLLRKIVVGKKEGSDKPFIMAIREYLGKNRENMLARTEHSMDLYQNIVRDSETSFGVSRSYSFIDGKLSSYAENMSNNDDRLYYAKGYSFKDNHLVSFVNGLSSPYGDNIYRSSFSKLYTYVKGGNLEEYAQNGKYAKLRENSSVQKYMKFNTEANSNDNAVVLKFCENIAPNHGKKTNTKQNVLNFDKDGKISDKTDDNKGWSESWMLGKVFSKMFKKVSVHVN